MAEIVNLRSIRKRKAREEDASKADENRLIHGRSRSEKLLEKAQARQATARLDAHQREYKADLSPPDSTIISRDDDA